MNEHINNASASGIESVEALNQILSSLPAQDLGFVYTSIVVALLAMALSIFGLFINRLIEPKTHNRLAHLAVVSAILPLFAFSLSEYFFSPASSKQADQVVRAISVFKQLPPSYVVESYFGGKQTPSKRVLENTRASIERQLVNEICVHKQNVARSAFTGSAEFESLRSQILTN